MNVNKIIISLSFIKGVGKVKTRKILSGLQNFNLTEREFLDHLKQENLIKEEDLVFFNQHLNKAENILEKTANQDIKVINFYDEEFPEHLKNIPNPPIQLFIKGNISKLNNLNKSVAIIGTRNPEEISKKTAFEIAEKLTQQNYIIVSGLAKGCDTAAHEGCTKSKGSTIAVLPSNLHNIYPKNNTKLAEKIIEFEGCLVSEYFFGQETQDHNFVERDRLQSGLSCTVILIQSDIKGGSMHTINFAKKQNRKIYVMKPVDVKNFLGNQKIINEGLATEFSSHADLKIIGTN
tara:strand:+ start:559 stop:1431 length:873 start_codon:yes stop_codon:yes gene_type:complete